jgi:hypothetical protein
MVLDQVMYWRDHAQVMKMALLLRCDCWQETDSGELRHAPLMDLQQRSIYMGKDANGMKVIIRKPMMEGVKQLDRVTPEIPMDVDQDLRDTAQKEKVQTVTSESMAMTLKLKEKSVESVDKEVEKNNFIIPKSVIKLNKMDAVKDNIMMDKMAEKLSPGNVYVDSQKEKMVKMDIKVTDGVHQSLKGEMQDLKEELLKLKASLIKEGSN